MARTIMRSNGDFREKIRHAQRAIHARTDGGDAFIRDPSGAGARARTTDDFAQSLAEQFVGSVTTAQSSDAIDDVSFTEELGGPFVTTRAKLEFGRGLDPSNPADAEQEALPTVGMGLVGEASDDDLEEEE